MKNFPTNRRPLSASLALLAMLAALQTLPARCETRARAAGKPLLQLQQEFVDLRFGMFIHFNLATFQDREWGDPADSPQAFNPTNLDTDQWASPDFSPLDGGTGNPGWGKTAPHLG